MRPAKNPFHPGEILLEEFLQPAKITQAAFAEKIGWTRSRLSEFIHGKRGVSAGTSHCHMARFRPMPWTRTTAGPRPCIS